jgi:hypothetical protein
MNAWRTPNHRHTSQFSSIKGAKILAKPLKAKQRQTDRADR